MYNDARSKRAWYDETTTILKQLVRMQADVVDAVNSACDFTMLRDLERTRSKVPSFDDICSMITSVTTDPKAVLRLFGARALLDLIDCIDDIANDLDDLLEPARKSLHRIGNLKVVGLKHFRQFPLQFMQAEIDDLSRVQSFCQAINTVAEIRMRLTRNIQSALQELEDKKTEIMETESMKGFNIDDVSAAGYILTFKPLIDKKWQDMLDVARDINASEISYFRREAREVMLMGSAPMYSSLRPLLRGLNEQLCRLESMCLQEQASNGEASN